MLIDTHAHLHFPDYTDDLEEVLQNAGDNNVVKIITVGTDLASSQAAVALAQNPKYDISKTGMEIFATVGLHPHDAKSGSSVLGELANLAKKNQNEIVAIGECGLDYYRNLSSRKDQKKAMLAQIDLAQELDLPIIFHVRDAWDDFFETLSGYKNIRGVIHSFTGGPREVERANRLGLYFGLNGIVTFSKDQNQLAAAKMIPINKLLLETDCPYLSPAPTRGKRNEPASIALIAKFLADLRGVDFNNFATQTTTNAKRLFDI